MKVFVYGTLKKGYGNHRLLKDATFVGAATLNGSHVLLDAGFPVCMPLYTGVSHVTGEVYEVTEMEMKSLDRLEGEGHMYHRVKRKVTYSDDSTGNVWVYIGDRKYWKAHATIGSKWIDEHGYFIYKSSQLNLREAI